MNRLLNNIALPDSILRLLKMSSVFALCLIATFGLVSCNDKEEPDYISKKNAKTSILLYAVASNNLYPAFEDDMEEIIQGLENTDLEEVDMLVYSVTPNSNATLKRAVRDNNGQITFTLLKEYKGDKYSTDPQRIANVIHNLQEYSEADNYGLILWSHGTGWVPNFSDHILPTANYSFGQDKVDGKSDYCDIHELADAIPDNFFNYIWFDCCYMASIETYYQLRNKADFFVGSPMELAGEGNPYHIVLPYLAQSDFSLTQAVDVEYRYFINRNIPVALSIVDTSYLEDIAFLAEKAVTGKRPSQLKLQTYHRPPLTALCDFGQYTTAQGASLGNSWSAENFNSLLDKLVIYKAVSPTDWRNRPIDRDNYSGISVFYFEDLGTDEAEYYKGLDWFKAVYTTIPPFI